MNQQTFIAILSVYTAYILIQVTLPWRDPSLTRKEDNAETLNRVRSLSTTRRRVALTLTAIIFVLASVGLIGMFSLWSSARWFYLVAILLKIFGQIAWPINVKTTHSAVIRNEVELLSDGAILVLVFYSPAARLFES